MKDTRPETIQLFDTEDRRCGSVELPPRGDSAELRRIIWQGRTFLEGDGTGFYGHGQASEIVKVTE